ncbi:hypothetical protein PPYR_10525 [Photinus pyralis]|uniref:Ribosomal RNA-processing protein 42 n=1 Tax=Photinus pyralis TaxID=7054 RepID=A0A5N4AGL4_PHOPY|nr:exosome complex component RRP42 [Photinus pyralis]KAB0796464.1 hypothetical protein PPYR_10525 [Photinus pyralis]
MNLCEAEKTFILHGVEENFRVDGRERSQYRPMELETNVVAHAFGSSRLRLANTDVLVAVKIETDVPSVDQPDEGKIEFFVDCSANATPDFEGRGGEELATEIANSLTSAYRSTKAFNLSKLCILKGRKCWKLYVDILLLECGGNLYDAVSLAVKAALWNTDIPRVLAVNLDGNNVEMEVSDNIHECVKLDIVPAPVMVTISKIGEQCVVDPSAAEEQCATASMVVAVSQDRFTTVLQSGSGSLHPSTLRESLKLGLEIGSKLDQALIEVLKQKPAKKQIGFLM